MKCDKCDRNFETQESLNQHINNTHEQITKHITRKLATGKIAIAFSIVVLVALVGYFSLTSFTGRSVEAGAYDDFAKCLTEKGAKFFGTYWCPYCAKQKELIGPSMQYINYIECDPRGKNAQPELCIENNIEGYPTWIINGSRYEGVQNLEKLSQVTSCLL